VSKTFGTPVESRLITLSEADIAGGTKINPEAVPGLTDPLWAVTVKEVPDFGSDGIGKPYERAADVVGTYHVIFINARTGAYVFDVAGELTHSPRMIRDGS
jgi:hypothetical protein